MADVFGKLERSAIMRKVLSRNTKPELVVKTMLRHLKIGFRHQPKIAGNPDFIVPHARLAIFVNGCFWHGHAECKHAALPSSNVDYWRRKTERNRRRDRQNTSALRNNGWRTAVIWECRLCRPESVYRRLASLVRISTKQEKSDGGRFLRSKK